MRCADELPRDQTGAIDWKTVYDEVNWDHLSEMEKVLFVGGSWDYEQLLQEVLADPGFARLAWQDGSTLLHYAATDNEPELANALITAGADINALDPRGTALHIAVRQGHDVIADMLVHRGACLDKEDQQGNTPMHFAAMHGRTHVIQLMLNHGASFTAVNKEGFTPLDCAANCHQAGVARFLVSAGAKSMRRTTSEYLQSISVV